MKKKKKHVKDEPYVKKPSAYKTIKCPLKTIVRNASTLVTINDLVIRCNDIVTETYQFIRLYCLHKYEKKLPIPDLNEEFIMYAMKALGTRDNRGRQATNSGLQDELNSFYETEFKVVLTHEEKYDRKNMSYLFPYLVTQIHTGIHNNLKEHFITRLLRFINNTVGSFEKDLDSKESKKKERLKLKNAIYINNPAEVPERYKLWYEQHRNNILPESWDVSLGYDCKVYPCKYIRYSFYMNSVLETLGCKLFQPLSLRNSVIPHYVTFDTASIVSLFGMDNRKKMLDNIKENQQWVWNRFFNLDLRVFKVKNYKFNFTLQTDGIGVSMLFTHKLHRKRCKSCPDCEVEPVDHFPYVEDLKDEELADLKNKKIIGGDPGKFFLCYLTDGEKKLKYGAFQRRTESMSKRNSRIMQREKIKYNVIEQETTLSDYNSKTVDYTKFKQYLQQKNRVNDIVKEFYQRELFRKLKWRQFVYTKKSEDKFINHIKKTFGSPEKVCIAYGDWSRSTQMKHFAPTKGIGMRRLLAKTFKVILINEFRTSKTCCNCHKELCNMVINQDDKKKKVFRCLVCKECGSSESKKTAFVTRDLNSALNIRNLAISWIHEKNRPSVFCRTEGLAITDKEKVGQSVDFTVGNATN